MAEFLVTEGLVGSGAKPKLPVQRLLIDRFGPPIPPVVLPPIRSHLYNATEAARLNHIDGIVKVRPATLLHAALQNLLAGTNRVSEFGALLDGMGDRLFQIDVLARRQGVDRHGHVPVVRRRDDHCINVLRKNVTIIQVDGCQAVRAFLNGIAVGPVHITGGHNLIRSNFVGSVEKTLHSMPGADDSNAKGVIRAEH